MEAQPAAAAAAAAAGSPTRSSTRKRKAEEPPTGAGEEDGVDFISNLSDDNLRQVISLLPMKDGACTEVLASRWRHLWRSTRLSLSCRDLSASELEGILDSRLAPVRSLTIFPENLMDPEPTLDALLQCASLDNLEELDLWYHELEAPPQSAFRFSPTLTVITIRSCFLPDGSIQGLQFPLLKQLALRQVTLSDDSLRYMLAASCCPALQWLLIDACSGFRCIRINSVSLVTIRVCPYRFATTGVFLFEELIVEDAPSLERLIMLDRGLGKRVSVISAPKLEALQCIVDKEEPATKVSFGSMVIQGLEVDNLMFAVRTVRILSLDMDPLSLDTVLNWLRCFPCVEKLYIQETGSRPAETNLWRRKHKNLIKCLDIPLKTIAMKMYRGIKSHVSFVTFFLLNVRGLESMTLSIRADDNTEEYLKEQRIKLQLENDDGRLRFTTHSCDRTIWDILNACDLDLADPFVVM